MPDTLIRLRMRLVLAVALLGVPSGIAHAHDPTLLNRGRDVAARCARCHAIDIADESPQRITPPFRTLHRRYPIPMLVTAARTGIIDGHDEMPEFDLDRRDMRALLAYIDSLNPTVPGYAAMAPE